MQILIVDDEVLIADGLRDMLAEALGDRVRVLVCYSAAEALRIVGTEKLNVIMTDINMPNIFGLELHRQLAALQPDCKVIYLTGYSEFEYARQALAQHAFAYILKGEGDESIVRTVRRAMGEPEEVQPAEAVDPAPSGSSAASGTPSWVQELAQYIGEHIDRDLSLQELAAHIHFHPVYLSRAFKEAMGVTVSDYISSVRLERAKALLSGSRMDLQQIAEKTGFASTNYFCRWFRKEMRMTPKAYRDQKH